MKFSDHVGKGVWTMMSRGLVVLYGVITLALMKVLVKEEFGTLSFFQLLFTMLYTFSDNFALQAIVKFGLEPDADLEALLSTSATLLAGFFSLVLIAFFAFSTPLADLLKQPQLPALLPYLLLLAFVTIPRAIFFKVLQMRFRMRDMFFVDLANFGVSSVVIFVMLVTGRVHTALDVVQVTIASAALSSIVATLLSKSEVGLRYKYVRHVYSKVYGYIKFQSATGVVAVFQQQFDTLIVSAFTGTVGVANYQGAKNLYRIFDEIRNASVVFIFPATSRYAGTHDWASLKTMLNKAISFLYLAIVPLAVFVAIAAPLIYHTIWGHKYDESIPILRVLMIAGIFLPMQIVFPTAMTGLGRVKELLVAVTIGFLADVALSLALLPSMGVLGAAVAFVAAMGIQAVLTMRVVGKTVELSPRIWMTQGARDALNFLRARRSRSS
jgi:O-antigen/teichoic acid export membrane protein